MGASIGIALSAYQTVSGFQSAQRQASAASAQGQYQKTIFDQNAKMADLQATDALQRGQLAEQRSRLETRQQIGSTRADLAAQGIDVGSGSAADVQASQAGVGELDALTIRNNAAREAYGYKVEALNASQQGRLAAFSGDQAASGYRVRGVSTLLTGGLNVADRLYAKRNADQAAKDRRTKPYRTP